MIHPRHPFSCIPWWDFVIVTSWHFWSSFFLIRTCSPVERPGVKSRKQNIVVAASFTLFRDCAVDCVCVFSKTSQQSAKWFSQQSSSNHSRHESGIILHLWEIFQGNFWVEKWKENKRFSKDYLQMLSNWEQLCSYVNVNRMESVQNYCWVRHKGTMAWSSSSSHWCYCLKDCRVTDGYQNFVFIYLFWSQTRCSCCWQCFLDHGYPGRLTLTHNCTIGGSISRMFPLGDQHFSLELSPKTFCFGFKHALLHQKFLFRHLLQSFVMIFDPLCKPGKDKFLVFRNFSPPAFVISAGSNARC